jgi:hypothetical protein
MIIWNGNVRNFGEILVSSAQTISMMMNMKQAGNVRNFGEILVSSAQTISMMMNMKQAGLPGRDEGRG